LHRGRGQHFYDCGRSAKADFQTRPLNAPDPDLAPVAATCHNYRRRAPHPLAPWTVLPAEP